MTSKTILDQLSISEAEKQSLLIAYGYRVPFVLLSILTAAGFLIANMLQLSEVAAIAIAAVFAFAALGLFMLMHKMAYYVFILYPDDKVSFSAVTIGGKMQNLQQIEKAQLQNIRWGTQMSLPRLRFSMGNSAYQVTFSKKIVGFPTQSQAIEKLKLLFPQT